MAIIDFIQSLPWPPLNHLFQYGCVLLIYVIPKKLIEIAADKELKWAQKIVLSFTLTAHRKAEIILHTRQHGGRLKGCAECQYLTRAVR